MDKDILEKTMRRKIVTYHKVTLYHALLSIDTNDLTDADIEIGYGLSRDRDIQDILKKALEKERKV